jgi:HCOMODA/2-hydroxy-3-carboxy-muconic semialdehyde decarboxylase
MHSHLAPQRRWRALAPIHSQRPEGYVIVGPDKTLLGEWAMQHRLRYKAGALLALGVAFLAAAARAQQEPKSSAPVDPAMLEELVAANHILVHQNVLDGFGHVSVRHPSDPKRYLMSRNIAPELVTASDILEFDLDSNPIEAKGQRVFLERFIHGEVYKARPDVQAVVHSHSPSVIPFGIATQALRPVFHMSGFLAVGVPTWEIREAVGGPSNMLVSSIALGKQLAATLGDRPVVLMRGHGNVIVGPNVKIAVYRAVYTEVNARLQLQAQALGAPLNFLTPEEGQLADATIMTQIERPWQLWRKQAAGK